MTHRSLSRRIVLTAFACFATFQLVLNAAMDTVLPEWREPEYGHRIKELKPLAHAARPRPVVVALGTSRTEQGLSPTDVALGIGPEAPLVYNLSEAGCRPIKQLVNMLRIIETDARPDYVLVEILGPLLFEDGTADVRLDPRCLALDDLPRLEAYWEDPDAVRQRWARARLLPCHAYRHNLMSHSPTMREWLPLSHRTDLLWKLMEPGGWMPYPFAVISNEQREHGWASTKREYEVRFATASRFSDLTRRAYSDLITLCRAKGICIAFYLMPESARFRALYPPERSAELESYYTELRESGVAVFDASTWVADESQFADGHHLMRHGAMSFSRRFGSECVGPWVGR